MIVQDMKIREISEEDLSLRLCIEGNIDRTTSQTFLDALVTAFSKSASVIIDMKDVSYVSSAGLRSFILAQKTAESKSGSLTIINVAENVSQVFRTTGFDRTLHIE